MISASYTGYATGLCCFEPVALPEELVIANSFAKLTAEEAAQHVTDGSLVAFSGFTTAGAPKMVPVALADRARQLHLAGEPFRIRVLTGASVGKTVDDALAEADAISWRAPYQSSRVLRNRINEGQVAFVDMHLSQVPQALQVGVFGQLDVAIIEATEVSSDGRVYLSTSVGASPMFLNCAQRVIIEVNRTVPRRQSEMADILPIHVNVKSEGLSLHHPLDRIGHPYVQMDPRKIIGVVETDRPDQVEAFDPPDAISKAIASHVVDFLLSEMHAGRIPASFLPLQSGVGNIANAVMAGLGDHREIPDFFMYTEVLQDALIALMESGRLKGASTCALTLSPPMMQYLHSNLDLFESRIVLRSQDLSNNPAILRQLGVISMNTALEVDIYGHVNSTHVCGQRMMNGIGGSGDFARNAYLSMFMCPSFAKGGRISTIVPMCSHVDHSEHSVQIIVTEHGLADLRGLSPGERAPLLIQRCAHPAYRDYLSRYVASASPAHIRHDLGKCFELHQNLLAHGAMLPDIDFQQFLPENR